MQVFITELSGDTRVAKVQNMSKAALCKQAAEGRGATAVIQTHEANVREFSKHMVEYAKVIGEAS